MPFTLEELLPEDQRLRTVFLHDSVQQAINLMHQHSYNQLPVVDKDGKTSLEQVVTFDSILQAVRSFNTKAELMHVRDVARSVRTYPKDADLLATLDDIQRENFALIVDDNNVLTGIVTTADTTVFFREYAQDLMLIEGIESRMKEAISALYAGNDAGLESAIAAVTDRAADNSVNWDHLHIAVELPVVEITLRDRSI
jgi:CBS domain-containing protein